MAVFWWDYGIIIGKVDLSVAIDPGVDLGSCLFGKAKYKHRQQAQDGGAMFPLHHLLQAQPSTLRSPIDLNRTTRLWYTRFPQSPVRPVLWRISLYQSCVD